MTLRLGLYAPTWPAAGAEPPRWLTIRELARDIEVLGIDTLWVADEPGFWECWTMLTAVAMATERIEVGSLVACTRYRNPALLATMIRALDEVSGGRLVVALGSGVGPTDDRWTAFGYDATSHVSRFAEAVEIVTRLLREGPIAFDGAFERVADPDIGPLGPRPTGPPIWVAAHRPRAMDVAVRWGEAVNGAAGVTDRASVGALRADVEAACARVGRDPSELQLTGWTRSTRRTTADPLSTEATRSRARPPRSLSAWRRSTRQASHT